MLQTFDSPTLVPLPKLPTPTIDAGVTPQLVFQGSYAPNQPTVEFYKVGKAFGPDAIGEFDALYGLNRPAENRWYTKPSTENLNAVITKDGETMCSPGQHMVNGMCVDKVSESGCEPGWVKKGAVCVAKTELSSGEGVTPDRMKKYLQEMQSGTASPVNWYESPLGILAIVLFLVFIGVLVYKYNKSTKSSLD